MFKYDAKVNQIVSGNNVAIDHISLRNKIVRVIDVQALITSIIAANNFPVLLTHEYTTNHKTHNTINIMNKTLVTSTLSARTHEIPNNIDKTGHTIENTIDGGLPGTSTAEPSNDEQ